MKLELPYPPGVNTLYGIRAVMQRGRPMAFPYKTHEHRDYAAQAKLAAFEAGLKAEQLPKWHKPIELSLKVRLYRPRRAGDIDGPLKTLLDVLQGVVFENDDQVARLEVYRHDDKARPRVELEVSELVAEQPELFPTGGGSFEGGAASPRKPPDAGREVSHQAAPRPREVPDEPWSTKVRRLATPAVVRNR